MNEIPGEKHIEGNCLVKGTANTNLEESLKRNNFNFNGLILTFQSRLSPLISGESFCSGDPSYTNIYGASPETQISHTSHDTSDKPGPNNGIQDSNEKVLKPVKKRKRRICLNLKLPKLKNQTKKISTPRKQLKGTSEKPDISHNNRRNESVATVESNSDDKKFKKPISTPPKKTKCKNQPRLTENSKNKLANQSEVTEFETNSDDVDISNKPVCVPRKGGKKKDISKREKEPYSSTGTSKEETKKRKRSVHKSKLEISTTDNGEHDDIQPTSNKLSELKNEPCSSTDTTKKEKKKRKRSVHGSKIDNVEHDNIQPTSNNLPKRKNEPCSSIDTKKGKKKRKISVHESKLEIKPTDHEEHDDTQPIFNECMEGISFLDLVERGKGLDSHLQMSDQSGTIAVENQISIECSTLSRRRTLFCEREFDGSVDQTRIFSSYVFGEGAEDVQNTLPR